MLMVKAIHVGFKSRLLYNRVVFRISGNTTLFFFIFQLGRTLVIGTSNRGFKSRYLN